MIRHDPARARTVLSQARDICREDGISAMEAEALLGLGIAARMDGDFGTALDAFAEASSLTEGHPVLAAMVNAHRGATEAACDAIENAVDALATAESQLQSGWDAVADTIHDALLGFIDLARARRQSLRTGMTTSTFTWTSRSTVSLGPAPSRRAPHRPAVARHRAD